VNHGVDAGAVALSCADLAHCPSAGARLAAIEATLTNASAAILFSLGSSDQDMGLLLRSVSDLLVTLERSRLLRGFSFSVSTQKEQTPEERWWWPLQISLIVLAAIAIVGSFYQGQCSCRPCLKRCAWCRQFITEELPSEKCKADPPAAAMPPAKTGPPRIIVMRP
jgi:hypothetical protein